MKAEMMTGLFSLSILLSISPCLILPSYGMDGDPESIDSGHESLVLHHQKARKLKNQKKLYWVTSLSFIERKLKREYATEQMEAALRKVAQVFNPNTFDQSPQMDHITTLWEEAAKQGNFAGLYNFGWRLQRKEGKKEIFSLRNQKLQRNKHSVNSRAFYWWHKAHTSQDARAWAILGLVYEYGYGVRKDYGKASEWYLKAAEQNHAAAQRNMGILYYYGRGVQQNYREAGKWLLKAADQNDAVAQRNVGLLYHYGQGVEQDQQKAMAWLIKSADQSDAGAQYHIGTFYYNGQGVEQNYAQAMEWFQKAAMQNHIDAQILSYRCRCILKTFAAEKVNDLMNETSN